MPSNETSRGQIHNQELLFTPMLAELQNFLPENIGWKLTQLPKETFREETYQIQIVTSTSELMPKALKVGNILPNILLCLPLFYISWSICCWPLWEAGTRAEQTSGHLFVAVPEIVIKGSPASLQRPKPAVPHPVLQQSPCICTGWVSIGCGFRSSSLAWWQVQVQPKKGEEGKQRELSFHLFLEYCSVPTLLCAKEEVRRGQIHEVTVGLKDCKTDTFEHRSHTQASAPGSKNC